MPDGSDLNASDALRTRSMSKILVGLTSLAILFVGGMLILISLAKGLGAGLGSR